MRAVKDFESLSDVDCDALVRFMRIRRYESGAVIFERGKPGDSMLMVVQGAISVVMPGPRHRNIEVARVGVGEVVGEMSCIDPAPHCATIMAALRTTAYEFGRRDLVRMQELAPDLAATLVATIMRGVTMRLERVEKRIERELAGHLAARIPELREGDGPPEPNTPKPAGTASEPGVAGTWDALLARLRGRA